MSYFMPQTEVERCTTGEQGATRLECWPGREADLGAGLKVVRALPVRAHRRLVGPWCFVDHFGPLDLGKRKAMDTASPAPARST